MLYNDSDTWASCLEVGRMASPVAIWEPKQVLKLVCSATICEIWSDRHLSLARVARFSKEKGQLGKPVAGFDLRIEIVDCVSLLLQLSLFPFCVQKKFEIARGMMRWQICLDACSGSRLRGHGWTL